MAGRLGFPQRIARAIANPSSVTARLKGILTGPEPLLEWQTRAVLKVIERHHTGKQLGRYWPTEKAIAYLAGPEQ
jgi:hypothetical protein